jgi:hypothetical protein
MTVVLNFATAPDGTQHGSRATSGGNGHVLRQNISLTPGTTYTFSFFARNNGGSAASYCVYDYIHNTEIVPTTSYFSQLTGTSYARVSITFTVPPGCTQLGAYVLRDSGAPVDVVVWGAKLEVGPTMTAYP